MYSLQLPNNYASLSSQVFTPQISPYQTAIQTWGNAGNIFNQNNPTPIQQDETLKDKNGNPTMLGDKDALGRINSVVGTAQDALNAANGAWGLFSSISQWGNQKAMNKEALKNAQMKNEALRFDIDNRKAEVARWNQIRSNVNKQMTNASAIKTSY